jgi:pimeloyl-ACP methyl ester carboxylesterase
MGTLDDSASSKATLGEVVSPDGTPIGYRRTGDGPPLVLVHGTAADHTRWVPVLPALEERFTVVAVDRRGRGLSGDAPVYAMEREYEDLAAVVDDVGGGAAVLGHSFGGGCALEAALLTGGVRRLVLYEPPLGVVAPPPETIARLEALLDAGDRDRFLAAFMGEVAGATPEQIELMRSLPAWQARLAAAHTIPRELRAVHDDEFEPARFRGLDVPTLLLGGSESPAAFGTAIEMAHTALPDSRVVTMPGQGHVAMDTGTELFLREVLAFLAEPAP